MKRFLVSGLFILAVLVPVFAEPLAISLLSTGLAAFDRNAGIPVELEGELVSLGGSTLGSLKKTFKTHDFSQLPFEQRSDLYENSQVPIAWPVWKNLLLGYGGGSKLQGDIGGQLFGQIADWTAASTIGVGMGMYLVDLFFIQMLAASSSGYEDPLKDLAVDTMVVGAIFLLAERIVQAILPIPYGARYNKTLRNGLGLNKDGNDMLTIGVSYTPVVSETPNQGLGVQVVGKVSISN